MLDLRNQVDYGQFEKRRSRKEVAIVGIDILKARISGCCQMNRLRCPEIDASRSGTKHILDSLDDGVGCGNESYDPVANIGMELVEHRCDNLRRREIFADFAKSYGTKFLPPRDQLPEPNPIRSPTPAKSAFVSSDSSHCPMR